MREWLRKWWPWLKAVLAIAILLEIGRRFARDLGHQDLWTRSLHLGWLGCSGVIYGLSLGFLALYWYRLLIELGQKPTLSSAVRAHYIGQLGKYLPGKAWALLLRSSLVRGPEVHLGVAIYSSFYEVLTSMASGALLSALLFALQISDFSRSMDWHAFRSLFTPAQTAMDPPDPKAVVLLSLSLFLVIGVPILPPIFNRLVKRMAAPFRDAEAATLPHVRGGFLILGFLITIAFWLVMGISLWAILQAVMPEPPSLTLDSWTRYTAYSALAYVAGFVIVLVPSGLGVRESFLMLFLVPEINRLPGYTEAEARATAALAVVLLRLVWTAAELVIVGIVYWLPGTGARGQASEPFLIPEPDL
jgi:uncharacterized membrane protein YbhN (UPF0104 family)